MALKTKITSILSLKRSKKVSSSDKWTTVARGHLRLSSFFEVMVDKAKATV